MEIESAVLFEEIMKLLKNAQSQLSEIRHERKLVEIALYNKIDEQQGEIAALRNMLKALGVE